MEKDTKETESTNKKVIHSSPVIDLTVARQKAQLKRKQEEDNQKAAEEARRDAQKRQAAFASSSWQSSSGQNRGAMGPGLRVSDTVFKGIRVIQVIVVLAAVLYLARSCNFV